jgi:hypothetical protein
MHRNHGNGTRYVCSNAIGEVPTCGMYLSVDTSNILEAVGGTVLQEIMNMDGAFESLFSEFKRLMEDADANPTGRQADIRELASLKAKLGRLLDAVEDGNTDAVTQERIRERRAQILALDQRLAQQPLPKPKVVLPTAEALRERLGDIAKRIRDADAEALGWMRTLVPAFSVRPVQLPGCRTVFLQAIMDVRLIALLEGDAGTFLRSNRGNPAALDDREVLTKRFELLLNDPPAYVRISKEAVAGFQAGKTLTELSREFKTDMGVIKRALALEGLTSAFTLVTELPNRRRIRKSAN